MKLVIGLGNPGEKYKSNRHNVGFMALDALASRVNSEQWLVSRKFHSTLNTVHRTLTLAKPTTFMNSSGKAVKKLVAHYKLDMPDLWVIHDDLDLLLGSYKIQKGKGPKEHKGLLSIYNELGSSDFWHVRVGIENRNKESGVKNHGHKISGEKYVLQDFTKDELEILQPAIARIVEDLFSQLTNH